MDFQALLLETYWKVPYFPYRMGVQFAVRSYLLKRFTSRSQYIRDRKQGLQYIREMEQLHHLCHLFSSFFTGFLLLISIFLPWDYCAQVFTLICFIASAPGLLILK